jgi:sec-independent protein translocase protein TatA
MMRISATQVIVILAVVLLLFGAPKLPELARSIGKSMRILKEETQELTKSGSKNDSTTTSDATSGDDEARGN